MIWQNPWAWTGLAGLLLPIVIHMLGRGRARVQPFPTLRFLQISRLLPTRRTQLQDLLLLALRLGVLLAAVAAIAQPSLLTPNRKHTLDSALARAIIVDTSASMQRTNAAGDTDFVVAQRAVQQLVSGAATAVVLQDVEIRRNIPGALKWLASQTGRAELVIISDFQRGSLDSAALAAVPVAVGITLVPVTLAATTPGIVRQSWQGNSIISAQITPTPNGTDVVWTAATTTARGESTVSAGSAEAAHVNAAVEAARSVPVALPVRTIPAIAIIALGSPDRMQLMRQATVPNDPATVDVAARIARDPLVADASKSAISIDTATASLLVLNRNQGGEAILLAGEITLGGAHRLVLFPRTDAGALFSVSVMAAAARAVSSASPVTELDADHVDSAALAAWQRPAASEAVIHLQSGQEELPSDGRWLWGVALLLLLIEWLVRRRTAAPVRLDVAVG